MVPRPKPVHQRFIAPLLLTNTISSKLINIKIKLRRTTMSKETQVKTYKTNITELKEIYPVNAIVSIVDTKNDQIHMLFDGVTFEDITDPKEELTVEETTFKDGKINVRVFDTDDNYGEFSLQP
jgi:hypothetical protein